MRSRCLLLVLGLVLALPGVSLADYTLWYSPLGMTTADSRLTIRPGSPDTSIRITTNSPGDLQWVNLGLTIPSDMNIQEIRFCYELASAGSFISQTRLSRMTTPDGAMVIHDDGTDLVNPGPTCYTSPASSLPVQGTITFSLRLNFARVEDWIDIGAIAIHLADPLSGMDSGGPGDSPVGLYLNQNQPNPAHPTTTITYMLDSPGSVELQIYDVGGRRVRTLFQGTQTAGEHGVAWDGRDEAGALVAAGTYYYAIRSGNQVDSRGMVLIH